MAEVAEYVVVIKGLINETPEEPSAEEDTKPIPAPKKSTLTSSLQEIQKMLHPIQSALSHNKGEDKFTYFGKEIAQGVVSNAETAVTLTLNRYFRLSEDYRSENYLMNLNQDISIAKSIAGSTISGAIGGSKFGPVGAVVGAGIGGGSAALNAVLNWQNTKANFYATINATNTEQEFRAKRAGLYDGGRGTEN